MQRHQLQPVAGNRVVAVFEASTEFFELPRAATLEDLADRLVRLSEWHDDALISVDIKLGIADRILNS